MEFKQIEIEEFKPGFFNLYKRRKTNHHQYVDILVFTKLELQLLETELGSIKETFK